ncbi:MAG TPA: tetratricopeptide repeat protein, partial [Pyrinomonadaceae bacterium]|nr:tetratricopeptide repeat protein [Pyrinomonadaceae bacterium]
ASAQQPADSDERRRAFELFGERKYLEALPLLEKLAAAAPQDAEVQLRLGFSLFARSQTLTDAGARRKERARARATLVRAKELGARHQLLDAMIPAIPPDGGEQESKFSAKEEANEEMHPGDAAYVKGETEKAVAAYGRALELDPKIYEAPLFAGDAYLKAKQFDEAGEWYARAIRINPDRETAYRYWGNALMTAGRFDEARDKYVEAIIADPYNNYVWQNGLFRWANQRGVRLAHPPVKRDTPPTLQAQSEGGRTIVNIDPKTFGGDNFWSYYDLTRATWGKANFAKEFPNETAYRHSLKEEATALRIAADVAARHLKEGKVKTLNPAFAALVKLEEEGLLEAYVLLGRADEGIARDYAAYRAANRDKLRRYLIEHVASGKY